MHKPIQIVCPLFPNSIVRDIRV